MVMIVMIQIACEVYPMTASCQGMRLTNHIDGSKYERVSDDIDARC
jgi:hypothetical protein